MINSSVTVPDWSITLGGQPLSAAQKLAVVEITFEERFGFTGKLEFTFRDGENFDIDPDLLKPQTPVTLALGWHTLRDEALFSGEIESLAPKFGEKESARLRVTALDRSYELKKLRWPEEVYDRGNILQVVKSILNKYKQFGLDYVVAPESRLRDWQLSDSQTGWRMAEKTDYEFLNMLAEANGFVVVVRGQTIYFVERNHFVTAAPTRLRGYYRPSPTDVSDSSGINLISFAPRRRSKEQREKIEVVAWHSIDASGKRRGGSTLSEERGRSNYTKMKVRRQVEEVMIIEGAADSSSTAQIMAQEEVDRRARKFVEGEARCKGWPWIRLGEIIEIYPRALKRMGSQFDGEYMVTGVEHHLSQREGYYTRFDVERDWVKE